MSNGMLSLKYGTLNMAKTCIYVGCDLQRVSSEALPKKTWKI